MLFPAHSQPSSQRRRDQKQYIGTITKLRKGQSLQELFGNTARAWPVGVPGAGAWK